MLYGYSSPSVPKPLKVPSLPRSVQKPLKVPSHARSVLKHLKVPTSDLDLDDDHKIYIFGKAYPCCTVTPALLCQSL